MNRPILALVALALLASAFQHHAQAPAKPVAPESLDKLLAPIALYPDALVTQILTCAPKPDQVKEVNAWLKANPDLKGTAAQDAASDKGFDAAFVAIVLFPDVLQMMADKPDWTTSLGQAFQQDRPGVLDSIQRLRAQAKTQGNLKTTEQQAVETVKTKSGTDVIVIQPANPQVVYVPQYNPQVVYTQPAPPPPPPSNTGGKIAAGLIGFTAGVIIGNNLDDDNDHYHHSYGGWGYHGPALSNDGWNDFAEHREDMAKDYYDHRENMSKQRGENTTARRETSGANQAARQENRTANQGARTESRSANQSARTEGRAQNTAARGDNQAARQDARAQPAAAAQPPAAAGRSSAAQASKRTYQGRSDASSSATPAADRSDAFSGYQKGSAERASSARGNSSLSRSSSGGGGGGGRATGSGDRGSRRGNK
jgi:hypothetical protein